MKIEDIVKEWARENRLGTFISGRLLKSLAEKLARDIYSPTEKILIKKRDGEVVEKEI